MKLNKALYGTKQAARCWWKFFQKTVVSLGFEASEMEPSLYLFRRAGQFIIIWLHVDDGFAVSSDKRLLADLRHGMEGQLEIKWSDNVQRLVGIEFTWDGPHLRLAQSFMANQIVESYHRKILPHHCPLPEFDLETYSGEPIDQTSFRSVIGSLMYLACGTRPDLAYGVNLLARFSSAPSEDHWKALDWLVGYLGRTANRALVYRAGNGSLDLWTDANWGGEHERSTTGYLLTHGGNSVAWGSKRQTVVAMSTCAAEYLALSEGAQQLAHLLNIFEEIGSSPLLSMHCDNEAAILIATDNTSKKKTKYLRRVFYFVNDLIRENNIKDAWNSTHNQLADVLTKRLGLTKMVGALLWTDVYTRGNQAFFFAAHGARRRSSRFKTSRPQALSPQDFLSFNSAAWRASSRRFRISFLFSFFFRFSFVSALVVSFLLSVFFSSVFVLLFIFTLRALVRVWLRRVAVCPVVFCLFLPLVLLL